MPANYRHAGPRPLPHSRFREALTGIGLGIGFLLGALAVYCIAGAPS